MVWLIPVLGLLAGILLGSILSFQIPLTMAKYLSIAVLASPGFCTGRGSLHL